jgi:hypothetical protein
MIRPLAVLLPVLVAVSVSARDLSKLAILQDNYPRVFFFRASESVQNARRYPTQESWEAQFDRLQGIIGKCLEEECLGREKRNPLFFSRFKANHPEQVVLLHFNGNSRDPIYHTASFFPGHWVYRKATMLKADVPAESGQTVIQVESARDFRVNGGRYRTSNDDIALFGMTADGKHDWAHCEQVKLVSVDYEANTITVERGCYGTKPLAFQAGAARAAAHMSEGPWGRNNHLLWYYNFSALCPRDAEGKNCADRVVDDLAEWFGPGGILEAFDGLEFDVFFNRTHGDTTGDGKLDNGVIDGVNQYGIGTVEFARQLRQRMGDNFIIQGDGALGPGGIYSQRAWGLLNGIESEGWPNLNDWEFKDWSGGLNRHAFWQLNARKPVFNYINHKWIERVPDQPGVHRNRTVPFSRHRLAFAAGQFTDAMICYSFAPKPDEDGKYGIWDEFRQGADHKLGWLGKPEGPALHLATQTPDLLGGKGQAEELAKRIRGDVQATVTPQGVRIVPTNPAATKVQFRIPDLPTSGPDLFLSVNLQADPMAGYPREMARLAYVEVAGGMIDLMVGEPEEIGMKFRGAEAEEPLDTATGATYQNRPRKIGDVTKRTIFVHPPWRDKAGYTYWVREVDVPANAELRFLIGMGAKSPERSDGVWFSVLAAPADGDGFGDYRTIFEANTNRHEWLPEAVSLKDYAGQRIRLKFVADCGPKDNSTTDHAHWGEIRIVEAGSTDATITTSVQTMTWANDRPFTSTYYYPDIRSPRVNVSFQVESTEPILLTSVRAYAHPDAMVRVFEHGMVLANPSHRPYTFDLAALSPGRHYRRLQATANQDTETNNGQPVGSTVTLGERDALFLLRVE